MIQMGRKFVYGVRELRPIFCAPVGRHKLKMRGSNIAKLFVRTSDGIQQFILEDFGDHWKACEVASINRNCINLK